MEEVKDEASNDLNEMMTDNYCCRIGPFVEGGFI